MPAQQHSQKATGTIEVQRYNFAGPDHMPVEVRNGGFYVADDIDPLLVELERLRVEHRILIQMIVDEGHPRKDLLQAIEELAAKEQQREPAGT